jgi:hypothetical protein
MKIIDLFVVLLKAIVRGQGKFKVYVLTFQKPDELTKNGICFDEDKKELHLGY